MSTYAMYIVTVNCLCKSSHKRYPVKNILKIFAIFTEKQLCWSLSLKKKLRHRCFPVDIAKF